MDYDSLMIVVIAEKSIGEESRPSAPVLIKNETGETIIFWTHHTSKKSIVNPREYKAVPVPTLNRLSAKAKDYQLFFMIDRANKGYKTLTVQWNAVKATVFDGISTVEVTQRVCVDVRPSI